MLCKLQRSPAVGSTHKVFSNAGAGVRVGSKKLGQPRAHLRRMWLSGRLRLPVEKYGEEGKQCVRWLLFWSLVGVYPWDTSGACLRVVA